MLHAAIQVFFVKQKKSCPERRPVMVSSDPAKQISIQGNIATEARRFISVMETVLTLSEIFWKKTDMKSLHMLFHNRSIET